MIADIEVRLRNISKAMSEIIIPAIGDEQKMALEQADLISRHLKLIESQWKYALSYTFMRCEMLEDFAKRLGGITSVKILSRGGIVSKMDELHILCDLDSLQRSYDQLSDIVEDMISNVDVPEDKERDFQDLIIEYSRRQIRLEKSWFKETGTFSPKTIPISSVIESASVESAQIPQS